LCGRRFPKIRPKSPEREDLLVVLRIRLETGRENGVGAKVLFGNNFD